MRLLTILALVSAITCAAVGVGAQESSIPVSATSRAAVVGKLSEVLRREYVLSDEAQRMATLIAQQLRGGAYDTLVDADRFAAALTRDLRSVYLDKHLRVLPPERYRDFERIVSGSHGPEAHGGDAPVEVVSRLMNRDGRTSVGFLRMTRFDGSGAGLAAIDTAMRRLQGAEAVIIDLRASPGGDADAVKVLSSYFFAEPTHLVTSVGPRDASGQREQFERWTAPNALSSSFASVPLYLLIDGKTFSAAESFAFGLERLGRAQLIGAATGGGGFMNAPFTLAAGFGASISVGRTFDPRTGAGWQSTGVAPTVAVEPDHALNTALNIIAGRASANAGLDARAQGVYSAVQNYANAWYLGDGDEMLRLLDAMYTGLEVDEQTPGVRFDAAARVGQTIDGAGFRTPRELRNREIAVLDVFGDVASSRLMLRETVHEVQLRWVNGTWRITSELISPKPRHGRGH